MDSNESAITQFVYGTELASYCRLAVDVLLLYDTIIAIDKVRYFRPFFSNSVNALYLLLRFGSVIEASMSLYFTSTQATDLSCRILPWILSLLDLMFLLCMDYILYLRVRAMYSLETHFKRVITFIQMLFAINTAVTLSSLISSLLKEKYFRNAISDDYGFCDIRTYRTDLRILEWAVPLAYECILMGLALYKAVELRSSLGHRGLKILKMIVRSQAIYFISVMICGIVRLVSYSNPAVDRPLLLILYEITGTTKLLVPLGVRMLMHQKEAADNKPEASFRNPSDISMAQFRPHSQDRVEDRIGSTGSIVLTDMHGPTGSHDAP